MLDLAWSPDVTKDPLILADAIELLVAFADDDCNGRFTQADFQRYLATENLFSGDQADEHNEQFEQALTVIKKRAGWLRTAYPFCAATDEVTFAPQTTISNHLPYLFLLICSNGNYVPSLKESLPEHFEIVCKEAFRSLFPHWAEVLLFSQNSEDRKTVFGWRASDAVPKLAEKLNAGLVNAERLSRTQREFGIDLIAICPFDDRSPYSFFAFAQCTLQQDWWVKRHEASAENELTGFVDLNANHSNFLMIPFFPRHTLDEWSEDPARTGNCILCDRFRICRLLEKSDFFDSDNPPESIADVFDRIEESLVEAPD